MSRVIIGHFGDETLQSVTCLQWIFSPSFKLILPSITELWLLCCWYMSIIMTLIFDFLPARRICKRGLCYGNVAGCLAGWVFVTRRYCIKTAKPVLKLYRPAGSPIILVFDPWRRYPIPRGTPSVMGAGSNGIIFDDLKWPLIRVWRSLYTYKSNISKTVRFRDKVTKEH